MNGWGAAEKLAKSISKAALSGEKLSEAAGQAVESSAELLREADVQSIGISADRLCEADVQSTGISADRLREADAQSTGISAERICESDTQSTDVSADLLREVDNHTAFSPEKLLTTERLRVENLRIIGADEVAELGAVKPDGFGELIRLYEHKRLNPDQCYSTEFPYLQFEDNLEVENSRFEMNSAFESRFEDTLSSCVETIFDNIRPEVWEHAGVDDRLELLRLTCDLIGSELELPEKWVGRIDVTKGGLDERVAAVSCQIERLPEGGVAIQGIPKLRVSPELMDSYYDAMTAIFHELVYIKQYAMIDSVEPAQTSDTRLLDLISILRRTDGECRPRCDYLRSPIEAEVRAQSLCFGERLRDIAAENLPRVESIDNENKG